MKYHTAVINDTVSSAPTWMELKEIILGKSEGERSKKQSVAIQLHPQKTLSYHSTFRDSEGAKGMESQVPVVNYTDLA